MDVYPMTPEGLLPALAAVGRSVSADDVLRAWMDADGVPRFIARCLVTSAPHVAAAALLDFADELYGCEEPAHDYIRGDVEWSRWEQAQALRERAWNVVNWKDDDPVDTVQRGRHRARDDSPTMQLPTQRSPLVHSQNHALGFGEPAGQSAAQIA